MNAHPKFSKTRLASLVTWATVAGNLLFVLWVLANGINEGFRGTWPERISYVALMGLLLTNTGLLLARQKAETSTTQSS